MTKRTTIDSPAPIPGAKHDLLTAAEEQALGRRARAGDLDARNALAAHNVRLVLAVAEIEFRKRPHMLPFEDLVQEGQIGLLKAIDRFDPERGLKFSTYATWWVRQAMGRALADHGRTIRLPVHMGEKAQRLSRAEAAHLAATGEPATAAQLAETLGWSVQQVDHCRAAFQRSSCTSLDAELEGSQVGHDGKTLGDLIADERQPAHVETVAARERRELARELLALLPERQRDILILRYGLDGGRPQTLEVIGQQLGLTRERVRQLEKLALDRLRALPGLSGAASLLEAA